MKLQKVYIRNFRGLEDVEVEFDTKKNVYVLIGNNGCGKTSILEAISIYCAIYEKKQSEYFDINKNCSDEIDIIFYLENGKEKIIIQNGCDMQKQFKTNDNNVAQIQFKGFPMKQGISYLGNNTETIQKQNKIIQCKLSKQNLDINDCVIFNASDDDAIRNEINKLYVEYLPKILYFGDEKHSKLHIDDDKINIKLWDDTTETAIMDDEERICFKDVFDILETNFKKRPRLDYSGRLCLDDWLPVDKEGSGVSIVICMVLVVFFELWKNKDKDIILMIDEIEIRLYPKLQESLLDIFDFFLKKYNLQIILTSHSPTFVKHCMNSENCEVLICKKDKEKIEIKQMKKKIENDYKFLEKHTKSQAVANFLAFNEYSTDLHNLLYGLLEEKHQENKITKELLDKLTHGDDYYWERNDKKSDSPLCRYLAYFIRNKIHHPENHLNDDKTPAKEFDKYCKKSIDEMIEVLKSVED
jgi:AAA15 family ATPase/GTPase